MFSTFVGVPSKRSSDKSSDNEPSSSSSSTKGRRGQVARACDACRRNRIKCDNSQPCTNCRVRKATCTNIGPNDARTWLSVNRFRTTLYNLLVQQIRLTTGIREIEGLKAKVEDLEGRLTSTKSPASPDHDPPSASASPTMQSNNPGTNPASTRCNGHIPDQSVQRDEASSLSCRNDSVSKLSTAYYKERMNSFFATVLQRPLPEDVLRPRRKKLLSHFSESYVVQSLSNQDPTSELSRTQQEYFLGLFWQHYHRTMPILNEKQVKEQYESFWSEPSVGDCGRRFAALADIILAVAVQLGTNFVPRDAGVHRTTRVIDTQDASVAGLSYFRRCQIAVTDDLEEPSLTTLQCYILSVVYLNNASFPNTAYQLLGLAVRIAYSLGLHKRPPDTLPKAEQELQRRIWWFLCSLDFNHLMEFGGPSTMQVIGDKQYPDDCEEIAKLSGINTFCPVSDITCLSFFNQLSKLYDAARTIYTTFHKKIRELNIAGFTCDVYENAKTLESCAGFFLECLNPLQTWTKHLPAGLQMRRKRNGKPLSLDRIPVDVDPDLPLWLQRQRLFLELFYHKILMDLCRFFIYFSPSTEINTPFTETHATSCVNHAITMTSIIHQVLTETDVINGWYDAYYLQWDATLSMLGFAFAHPLNPLTPTTFKMLDVAVLTFDIFGTKFSAATLAADLTRELKSSAVQLSERNASGSLITASSSVGTVPGLLSPSSSLDTRRNTVSSIDRNPQTQPNASRKTLDSTFSAFEDDLSPVMLSAPGNSTVPASSLADQFMLSINALDSQWSTMSDPNAIAWGSVNHLEFHDGADAGMPMFQAQQRNESESEDMVLVE